MTALSVYFAKMKERLQPVTAYSSYQGSTSSYLLTGRLVGITEYFYTKCACFM